MTRYIFSLYEGPRFASPWDYCWFLGDGLELKEEVLASAGS